MDFKKEPASAPVSGSTPVELVTIAMASGLGGPAVVTRRDGERLAKTGRWKIVGPAEPPVLETKGFPGLPQEPATEAAPQKPADVLKAATVSPKAPVATFGEDHED